MNVGADTHGRAVNLEIRADFAVPHVEGLVNVGNLFGVEVRETEGTEMEAVGIDAIPVGCLTVASLLVELHRIRLHTASSEVIVLEGFLKLQVLGIGKTVPAPLALSS